MKDEKNNIKKVKTGVVESIDDPTCSGRIKVRVKGLHDNIATESLPWCNYAGSGMFSGSGGGQISIPRVGQKVRVRFAQEDVNSMEWYGTNTIDRKLSEEIASDYAGSQVLLYDSEYDLSIKFQPGSGLVFYYKGSYMQMTPDNTVTIHYGPDETTGVQIQLTDGKIYIQALQQINITSGNEVNIEGKVITLNGESAVRIKGTTPNTCAVNATQLITLLQTMATNIDTKLGQSKSGICAAAVSGSKEKIMNQHILYI